MFCGFSLSFNHEVSIFGDSGKLTEFHFGIGDHHYWVAIVFVVADEPVLTISILGVGWSVWIVQIAEFLIFLTCGMYSLPSPTMSMFNDMILMLLYPLMLGSVL